MSLSLAYTISPELQNELVLCSHLRQQILIHPLSPKLELKLRWQAQVAIIENLLTLLNQSTAKKDILPFLFSTKPPKTLLGQTIVSLHQGLNYLYFSWTANPKTITVSTLEKLVEEISIGTLKKNLLQQLSTHYKDLTQLLNYLQVQHEQPVITAGLAQAEIPNLLEINPSGLFLARLASYLFLYQNGYDLRGMLALEDGLPEVLPVKGNATAFLLWFCQNLKNRLTALLDTLNNLPDLTEKNDPLALLNRRQIEALRLLDNLQAQLTNRDLQKRFKISQITASRDLARLAALNLIYSHGSGRSIYYTKI